MATMLITPKGVKKFNSFYLATVKKNELLKKGVDVKLVDEKEYRRYPTTRDCNLRTVYSANDQKELRKIREKYSPMMFDSTYREKKCKKEN